MLIHDNQYLKALQKLLDEADEISMAVAFWGAGSTSIFEGHDGKPLRIICNLALGGTNPAVICELQDRENTEVRQLDNLHAKLVLTKKAMIVGSANISRNGLGSKDKAAKLRELGIVSQDVEQLRAARALFDDLWKNESRKIYGPDLRAAQTAWEGRRDKRPYSVTPESGSLLDMPSSELKDRKIYFVIFRSWLSDEGEERRKEENNSLTDSDHPEHGGMLDAYEEWGDDEFPRDSDALIIPIYWGKRGKIEIYPAQRPLPDRRDDGMSLDFTIEVKDDSRLKLPFSLLLSNDEEWQDEIRDWLESYEASETGEPPTFCKPVYEFLKWREKSRRTKGAMA